MRSILPVSFPLLAACSEYNLAPQKTEDAAPVTSNSDVTGGEPETNEEGVEAEDPTDTATTEEDASDEPVSSDECGFLVNQPYANPDVETESLAVFSNIGDTAVEIRQGEMARYQIAVTALECGDIDLNLALFEVQDSVCEAGVCWIDDLALSNIPMYFTSVTDGITFSPYDLDQQVNNLIYVWKDEVSNQGSPLNGVNGNMSTIHVSAGTTKIIQFDFTATETIPVGSTISIILGNSQWTDATTGNIVWDWSGIDNKVSYTIVE